MRLIRAVRSLTLGGDSTRRLRLHAALWITFSFGGALGGCSHHSEADRAAQPAGATVARDAASAVPTDAATASQVVSATAIPANIGPAAGQTAAAVASPTAASPPPPSPEATGPLIFSVTATPTIVHAGDAVKWDVRTTSDVVSVSAHVAVYSFGMERRGSGRFGVTFTIPPNVPPMFRGQYTLEIIAKTASGAQAEHAIRLVFE